MKEILFVVSIITLIIIIYTEPQYNQTLFDKSLTIIPNIQEGASNFKIFMWRAYSNGGLVLAEGLPIVVCSIILNQRARAFYYVVALGCLLITMNVTKLYYHQARPFWASADVQAFGCST